MVECAEYSFCGKHGAPTQRPNGAEDTRMESNELTLAQRLADCLRALVLLTTCEDETWAEEHRECIRLAMELMEETRKEVIR